MLNAVVILNKKTEVSSLTQKLKKISIFNEINGFINVDEAVNLLREKTVNIVFADYSIEDSQGDEVSKVLHETSPETDLIYLAEDESHAYDAWKSFALGYLVKPVSDEDVINQLLKIYKHAFAQKDRIVFRCFGNFECFYKGQPINFERKQAKEFLAYLIDRKGAEVSENEIRAILWEDAEDTIARKSYLRTLASIIRKKFESLGQPDVFTNSHGFYCINMELIDCDYYEYLKGNDNMGTFRGEYMKQYSWAEETVAALEFDFYEE